jgi:hypothetical protein
LGWFYLALRGESVARREKRNLNLIDEHSHITADAKIKIIAEKTKGKTVKSTETNYKVTVVKEEILNPITPEELERLEREGKDIPPVETKSHLPQKYRLKASTTLDVTIPDKGDKEIKLELTD